MTLPLQFSMARLRAFVESADGRQRLLALSLLLLYPLLLLWVYRVNVAPAYAYMAHVYRPPDSVWQLVLVVTAAVLTAFMLPSEVRRPGGLILWMMYVLVYVPALVIPVVSFDLSPLEFVRLQSALVAGFGIMLAADRVPRIRLPEPPMPAQVFWIGFWAVLAVFTAILVWYVGIPKTLPSFGEVYDIRYAFIDQIATLPRPVAYIYSWLGQVFNPFLIAYAMARRSYLVGGIGVVGQLYLYGLSGEKSLLFTIFLMVGVYGVLTLARSWFVQVVAFGACALIVVSVVLDAILGTGWFVALFVQRLTVTPGLLTGAYFEFFLTHPKAMLGYSVLAPFVDYHYDTSIPYVIGRAFFDSPDTIANANIWADGYANFGIPGIILASLIAGAVIWVFNALSHGRSFLLGAILAAGVAFTWTNISIFTSMLTHGIALTLILLWAVPSERPAVDTQGDGVS